MGISVPQQGEHWANMPGWLPAETRQNYQRWIESYANQYGVPAQALYNMARQESNWDSSVVSRAGALGLMQWMPGTIADARRWWNWPDFDPANNPQHAIEGSARFLSDIYHQYYGDSPDGNWRPVFAGYNWGQNRQYLNNAETLASWNAVTEARLPEEPRNYVEALSRGLGSTHNLDVNYPWATPEERAAFVTGRTSGPSSGTGSTFPEFFQQEGINQETGPGGGMGGRYGNDYLTDLISTASANAGYAISPEVAATLQAIAPSLAAGPGGFSAGDFPWFSPGSITPDEGAFLQHHAFMPNNLVYNPETQLWDVPQEARFPAGTGIWGSAQVASLLPDLGEGFAQDYLTHLGYGATQEHNSGGLSNAYYGAPNLYGAPSSGQVGNWFGQTTSGYPWGTSGMGNQGLGNIADMSTYNQPFDYTQWLPGPSTHTLEPTEPAPPIDYQHYFQTEALPSGGFEGLAPIPVGLGYEGSHGITTIDPGVQGLGNAINQNAQNMINQGYQQAADFNRQAQVFQQQNLAPNGGWSTNFGVAPITLVMS